MTDQKSATKTGPLAGIMTEEIFVDDKGQGRTKNGDPAPKMTAGEVTLPLASEGAKGQIEIIVRAAIEAGHMDSQTVPDGGFFTKGQVFYKNGEVEEVRLELDFPAETNVQGLHLTWRTPTPPQIEYRDGQWFCDPNDQERTYVWAIATRTTDEPSQDTLNIRLDLRGDAQIAKQTGVLEREADLPRLLKLPNGAAERDLHRAMMLLPEWDSNENLCTRFIDGKEKTTVVYQPPEVLEALQDAPEKAMKALDERFKKIKSELTADIIDILFHHWKSNKIQTRRGERASITLTRICEYRDVLPKGENLENAWQAMRDARSIRLTGDGIDAALFEIDSADFLSPNIPEKDTAYFYSPGFFVQFGLEQNRLYFAPFLESVWKLDPYRNAEAKRLARFLRGEWRLNPQSYTDPATGAKRWRTWRDLLAEMGVFPDQWKAQGRKIARELEGIEKALHTLYDLEFLAETGEGIYHPDDRQRSKNLPTKGRLEAWLELRVCLLPAADIADALNEGHAKRIAQQERDAQALAKAKAQKQLRAQEKRRKKIE